MTLFNADPPNAGSHLHLFEHLPGPLASGGVETDLTLNADGRLDVTWRSREPLLVIAPKQPLGSEMLRLDVILDPDGVPTPLAPIHFAPFTEADAFIQVYRPPVDVDTQMANPFSLVFSITHIDEIGNETLFEGDPRNALRPNLIQGVMGRMIYLLNAEKLRMRTAIREIAHARQIDTARLSALDTIGAELGVARFADTLTVDSTDAGLQIVTQTRREPDSEYRRRLKLYRGWHQGSRENIIRQLNGEGAPDEPNAGLLGELGVEARFDVIEEDNAFAVAVHLISGGDPAPRTNFFNLLRQVTLVLPANNPAANTIHANRYLHSETKANMNALRARLRRAFTFDASAALAPALAQALDRLGRLRLALNIETPLAVLRTQDAAGGSRYELGLGADLSPMTEAEHASALNVVINQSWDTSDEEIAPLLTTLTPPVDTASDPDARWLLEAAGLRTVHRLAPDRLYVSHFPTFGVVINDGGVTTQPLGVPLGLEAYYEAPGLAGSNIVLETALSNLQQSPELTELPAWEILSSEDAEAVWATVITRPADDQENQVFQSAGLPILRDEPERPQRLIDQLNRTPQELFKTIRLDGAWREMIANDPSDAATRLRQWVRAAEGEHIVSILPLITESDLFLLTGVIGLPEAGVNLSARRATGFRWYVVPLQGDAGQIRPLGSRTTYVAPSRGLSAVVVIGYARRGLTDPYEFRVELPEGVVLSPLQYEFLMNQLDHIYPMGIEVNTFSIRREHVDLDADGIADPLLPTASRTYRQFRRARHFGVEGFMTDDPYLLIEEENP